MEASGCVKQRDTFLSDVHVGQRTADATGGNSPTVLSRFVFSLPSVAASPSHPTSDKGEEVKEVREREAVGPAPQSPELVGPAPQLPEAVSSAMQSSETETGGVFPLLDEDGDVMVRRRPLPSCQKVLLIEHALSTPLEDVGLQVWRGALLLADYLVHNRVRFQDSVILELGAGTGLLSIMAALTARTVFCTDVGERILELAQCNVMRSMKELDFTGSIQVRELDWRRPLQSSSDVFSWTEHDLKDLKATSFILAADVVYDDDLTDSLFLLLARLQAHFHHTPTILISLEKRINFTLEALAPASPVYQHFVTCLRARHKLDNCSWVRFEVEQLPVTFPQSFSYDRVEHMELWELTALVEECG